MWPEFPQLWKIWSKIFYNKKPINGILLHEFSLFYSILSLFHNFPYIFLKKFYNFKKCSGHSRYCVPNDNGGAVCNRDEDTEDEEESRVYVIDHHVPAAQPNNLKSALRLVKDTNRKIRRTFFIDYCVWILDPNS